MIECVFTLDYEIYGSGDGSLADLVCGPADALSTIFREADSRFVVFAETAELEMIEAAGSDADIDAVTHQLRSLHADGFEMGLHLHPWWYNARRENGRWTLDYSEYNMCALPAPRIAQMIDRSLAFLRRTLNVADFTPLSFRAGHLLFQPAAAAAAVLASRGIRLDSSVYKGGVWHQHGLDYRRAMANGSFWCFGADANVPDSEGSLLEIPIHTQMAPSWALLTPKRMLLERKAAAAANSRGRLVSRLREAARVWRPMKFDYCALTREEMKGMIDRVLLDDRTDPSTYRPLVAIGHTKDLFDDEAVRFLLDYLRKHEIPVRTFAEVYDRCVTAVTAVESFA